MARKTTTGSSLEQFRKLSVLHLTYLKYIGLWYKFDSNVSIFLRGLYYVYNKFVLISIIAFSATIFADVCSSLDDLSSVTDNGCMFTGLIVVVFKLMIFQTRSDRIIQLLHKSIDSYNQLCKFPIGNEKKILDKYLLFCRMIFYAFSVMGVCLGIGILFLVPLEKGQLPIKARYPFNTTVYPGHGISYSFEVYCVFIAMTSIVGMESFVINLCSMFLVQFAILNVHFKSCGNGQHHAMSNGIGKRDSLGTIVKNACFEVYSTIEASCGKDNYDSDAICRGGFDERFGRSIRNHQRLLAIVDDFNEIFSSCLFVQMFSSTSMICLTCFQFTLSALLMTSQWLSHWNDELSAKSGRLLILTLIFSKRTISLKAGAFFSLSMETFITIVKCAYSFFTLLSTMNLRDQ
ncbi:uncharacterized protein LOC105200573 isoform X2 [Solenopsis invicta]|uniref:uncharacterized protein LOC105200573 isoform X2 n=1 Tax=Solenopsis invicta TaxID=13686 RepID=UPI00193DCBAD|nr:uncharacterized protein LOC105200573 isoform X2 [Solenopsis invicta]